MLKRIGVKIFILAALFLAAASVSKAQTRVRFPRGRNSATLTGTIPPGGVRRYVLRAMSGQNLTATLSSGNGRVDFTQGAVHDTQFARTVEQNGDVYVTIDNHGTTTRYTLTISIQ